MHGKTDDAVEVLAKLVAFDTVSRNSNLDLIQYLVNYLEGYGIRSTVIPDVSGTKASLIATMGSGEAGIILSGHTDTVPYHDGCWTSPPLELTQRDGRLYGRGAADMKGFIACVLTMVPAFKDAARLRPVTLAFTYDEEVGCLAMPDVTRHLAGVGGRAALTVVGEPTLMAPVNRHKGSIGLITQVQGVSCHASRPNLGKSAIAAACEMVAGLSAISSEASCQPEDVSGYSVPHPTINVGMIDGGTARNLIAASCDFHWEMRTTSAASRQWLQDRLKDLEESVCRKHGVELETSVVFDVPPLYPVTDTAALELVSALTGENVVRAVDYGTEAGFYSAMGISTVVCGPGDIAQAHTVDEWIHIEEISRCLRFLDGLSNNLDVLPVR